MSDKTYAERFGTPSRPDGCPVLIAAALTKVETENAALRRDVYQCPPTAENDYEGFKWRDACEELECEVAALREALSIEQERSLYWRGIAGRKEAQPIRADHIGDIDEIMQVGKEAQP